MAASGFSRFRDVGGLTEFLQDKGTHRTGGLTLETGRRWKWQFQRLVRESVRLECGTNPHRWAVAGKPVASATIGIAGRCIRNGPVYLAATDFSGFVLRLRLMLNCLLTRRTTFVLIPNSLAI